MDEKRLAEIEKSTLDAGNVDELDVAQEEQLELICLARLGLWAEKHAVPALTIIRDDLFDSRPDHVVAREALAALPEKKP